MPFNHLGIAKKNNFSTFDNIVLLKPDKRIVKYVSLRRSTRYTYFDIERLHFISHEIHSVEIMGFYSQEFLTKIL